MPVQERQPQNYLLKKVGGNYYLCRQNPQGEFHKIGSSYNRKTILYRLETAAKLKDIIFVEHGEDDLASLVQNFARLLDEIKFKKTQEAIQKGLYVQPKAPASDS